MTASLSPRNASPMASFSRLLSLAVLGGMLAVAGCTALEAPPAKDLVTDADTKVGPNPLLDTSGGLMNDPHPDDPDHQGWVVKLGGNGMLTTANATASTVKIKWYRQPMLYNEKNELLNFWRVGQNLYLSGGSDAFTLISLQAKDGATNWQAELGYMPHILRPAEYHEYLVAINRTQAVLIDRRTGRVFNRANLGFAANTAPIISADSMCIGSGSDYFENTYIDLLGKVNWSIHSEAGNDAFVSQPVVVSGRRIIAASREGRLWCFDPDFGNVLWTFRKVTGNVLGGLAANDETVFVPSMDNKVFAFKIVDSGYLWDTHLEGKLDQTVVMAGKGDRTRLLVPSTGKGLYCLDPASGIPQWILPNATQIVSLSPTHVYVVGADGKVLGVRIDNGSPDVAPNKPIPQAIVDKTIPIKDVKFFATIDVVHAKDDPTIFAATADGRIMAIVP